jgi:hypothetical protein
MGFPQYHPNIKKILMLHCPAKDSIKHYWLNSHFDNKIGKVPQGNPLGGIQIICFNSDYSAVSDSVSLSSNCFPYNMAST